MLAGSVAAVTAVIVTARGPEAGPQLVAAGRGARWIEAGPGVRQRRANDCGPAALAHALRRTGRTVPFPDAASSLVPRPAGCRLDEIAAEAARLGVPSRLSRSDPDSVEGVGTPALLHLTEGHFVVLEGRSTRGDWIVWDPAFGRLAYSGSALAARWSGHALELRINPLEPSPEPAPREESE